MHLHPSYHWSPAAQRRFLAVLAETGSVGRACAAASKSRQAAYAFRKRVAGSAFATGWDAALIASRQSHADALLGYIHEPVSFRGFRHPGSRRLMWQRTDSRLGRGMGMTLLSRLDKAVAPILADPQRAAKAQAALADFDACLDAVSPDVPIGEAQPLYCQLAQKTGQV